MVYQHEDRPDAAGIRPLKAAVHNGRVYLDLSSLTEGFRARAGAVEAQGYPDVAQLYRREADELDTAAIGYLSAANPPTLPIPAELHVTVSMVAGQIAADCLSRNEPANVPATLPDGQPVLLRFSVTATGRPA